MFPSINELRYGGRRLVDVIHGLLNNASEGDIDGWVADARFDCHRARHDAIDTAISKIAIKIDIMVEKLEYEAIIPVFPEFPVLVKQLGDVRKNIARSRENREDREAIYTTVESTDFIGLVERFQRLVECEPIMKKIALKNRWRDVVAVVALVVALAALVVVFL